MHSLWSDLRSGIRMLLKYPTLSLVAILTLGLGIGLGTTVFSVVNGGLFKGLPFEEADRVVSLVATNPSRNVRNIAISVQDLAAWQARQTVFETFGPFAITAVNLSTEEGRPERFSAGQMTAAAFDALRVKPILGRGFRPDDDKPGAEPVIILSYEVWRDRFARSTEILGRPVRANGIYRTVVGVMPERFAFPILEKLWIPLAVDPLASERGKGPSYRVIARLKRGVSAKEARAQAAAIAGQLATDFPDTNRGLSANVLPYAETVLGPEIFALLYTMFGAGIGVLLIACVNVSNLLMARASLRQREVAVRIALGASRTRVLRQHLTEVLVLATAGGVLGVALSAVGMRWFLRALSVSPPPFWVTFELDMRVMLFVLALVVIASLFAGALPALHAVRTNAGSAMKDDSRSSTSARLGKFSGALVVIELAVSCGLLIAAGLMIKSVVQLKTLKMPFAIDNVLTGRINLPPLQYPDIAAMVRFYEQLLPKLRAIPGVEAATLSDGLPAAGNGAIAIQVDGRAYAQDADYPVVREGIVTPGYFQTFQTPLLAGREFTTADTATSQQVAIVNESFVRTHFAGMDAIGRRIRKGKADSKNPWLTIVGVVPDLLMAGIGNNSQSPVGYYLPIAQSDVGNFVSMALRTTGDPGAMAPSVRAAVAALDSDLAVYDIRTMDVVIRQQTVFYNIFGTFFTVFGVCALCLASAGLYGVMSFSVTQRTREMGVRAALGAPGRHLVGLIMRRSLIQLALGLVLGLGLGVAASGPLQVLLYHVDPRDPVVLAVVLAALAASSIIASVLPAWRVTKIDPVIALATE